jgi:hypothetical protein
MGMGDTLQHEADHSAPASAKVKNTCLHVMVLGYAQVQLYLLGYIKIMTNNMNDFR